MTLTTVVGSSGSGKTTFLNDLHKSNKCIYIRQYHNMRPYIAVSKIPKFEPKRLPYWSVYEKEGKADSIKVGGTMAGKFTAGLSGGQRKLLLFELICQRVKSQSNLLIVLDEPFAGVTDDFVEFVVDRLEELRNNHNVVLVTNDHIEILTEISDNIITVSSVDRSHVRINARDGVEREKAIAALGIGDCYVYSSSGDDLKFFLDVEIWSNSSLVGIGIFTTFSFLLVLVSFWDSKPSSAPLAIVATGLIAYFCINPYLLSLVDWRNAMIEESEALMHSSKRMNKFLKTLLTLTLVLIVTALQYGFINAVVDGLEDVRFFFAILFDFSSLALPMIALRIFSKLPFHVVEILRSLPFLFMIFFSTTFSPGAGIPGLKALRYLFPRFYFWCMLPEVKDSMDGCPPEDRTLLYLILSSFVVLLIFIVIKAGFHYRSKIYQKRVDVKRSKVIDNEFEELLMELYGVDVFRRLQHLNTSHHSKNSNISNPKPSGYLVM